MLDSTLLLQTVNKILSNSALIQELEFERIDRNNPPIRLFDFHDVFGLIISCSVLLLKYAINVIKYLIIVLIITIFIYEIVCYFVNGEFLSLQKGMQHLHHIL